MELPFTGFELSFLLVAFTVFFLLSLVSIFYEADASRAGILHPSTTPRAIVSTHRSRADLMH